jgi:hypothetical protein
VNYHCTGYHGCGVRREPGARITREPNRQAVIRPHDDYATATAAIAASLQAGPGRPRLREHRASHSRLAQECVFSKSYADSRRTGALLKTVLSNCAFDRGSLSPSYNKPFDILAKGTEAGDWRARQDSNLRPLAPEAHRHNPRLNGPIFHRLFLWGRQALYSFGGPFVCPLLHRVARGGRRRMPRHKR